MTDEMISPLINNRKDYLDDKIEINNFKDDEKENLIPINKVNNRENKRSQNLILNNIVNNRENKIIRYIRNIDWEHIQIKYLKSISSFLFFLHILIYVLLINIYFKNKNIYDTMKNSILLFIIIIFITIIVSILAFYFYEKKPLNYILILILTLSLSLFLFKMLIKFPIYKINYLLISYDIPLLIMAIIYKFNTGKPTYTILYTFYALSALDGLIFGILEKTPGNSIFLNMVIMIILTQYYFILIEEIDKHRDIIRNYPEYCLGIHLFYFSAYLYHYFMILWDS